MARPRKDVPALTPHDSLCSAPDTRLADIERAIALLASYIVERDQLRYVGGDADIVGVARMFRADE